MLINLLECFEIAYPEDEMVESEEGQVKYCEILDQLRSQLITNNSKESSPERPKELVSPRALRVNSLNLKELEKSNQGTPEWKNLTHSVVDKFFEKKSIASTATRKTGITKGSYTIAKQSIFKEPSLMERKLKNGETSARGSPRQP